MTSPGTEDRSAEEPESLPAQTASDDEPRMDPAEMPDAAPTAGGASGRAEVDAYGIRESIIAGAISHNHGELFATHNYYGSESSLGSLGARDFRELSPRDVLELSEEWFVDAAEIDPLEQHLRAHRILFLYGPTLVGKKSTAFAVFNRLGLQETGGRPRCMKQVSAPSRQRRVDFEILCEDEGAELEGAFILVTDALENANESLCRWIDKIEPGDQRSLGTILSGLDAYLVLTFDPSRLTPEALGRIVGLEIGRCVREPTVEALASYVVDCVAGRIRSGAVEDPEAWRDFAAEHGRELAEALRSAPRIHRFLCGVAREVVAEKLTLTEALRRELDLSHWLFRDLTEQQSAWSFVIALTLAQATPAASSSRGVAWSAFYGFWRHLDGYLRERRGVEKARRFPEDLGCDDVLLRRARAVRERGAFPMEAQVRFENDTMLDRLWDALLGPGHGILTLLLPELSRLAESPNFRLRMTAARALGRIGEIDPLWIIRHRLRTKFRSKSATDHEALGELFQGVFGSPRVAYREGCLDWLRAMYEDELSQRRDLRPETVRVAALCLRDIGSFDLSLSVGELYRLFRRILVAPGGDGGFDLQHWVSIFGRDIVFEIDGNRLHWTPEEAVARLRKQRDGPWAEVLLDLWMQTAEPRLVELLSMIRFGLVGLCFSVGPGATCRELQSWAARDEGDLSPVLPWLLLGPRGVFSYLGLQSVFLPGERRRSVSRVVDELSEAGARSLAMAAFFVTLYRPLSLYPRSARLCLREQFRRVLADWAEQAGGSRRLEEGVAVFLSRLFTSGYEPLQREVFSLLKELRQDEATRSVALKAMNARPSDLEA